MDNPVKSHDDGTNDGLASRVALVERYVHDIKEVLTDLRVMIAQTDAPFADPATKADIADLRTEMRADFAKMPTKIYTWGIPGVLLPAYSRSLAALAILK